MLLRFVAAIAALAAMPLMAQAATIDFSEAPSGLQDVTDLSLTNADITTTGQDIFIYEEGRAGTGPTGGICAIVGDVCTGSLAIGFTQGPVSDLLFEVASFDAGDSVFTSVFALLTGPALASREITAAGIVDFSGITGIRALVLLDLGSTGEGVFYRNFSFTQGTDTPAIPLPAALPVMLTALGALGLVRHRRA